MDRPNAAPGPRQRCVLRHRWGVSRDPAPRPNPYKCRRGPLAGPRVVSERQSKYVWLLALDPIQSCNRLPPTVRGTDIEVLRPPETATCPIRGPSVLPRRTHPTNGALLEAISGKPARDKPRRHYPHPSAI